MGGNRPGGRLSLPLFNIVLEGFADPSKKERKIKDTQTGDEEEKLSLFTDGKIIYIENPIESI